MSDKSLEERARELIKEWDDELGESWSDCSDEIARIMVEFYRMVK